MKLHAGMLTEREAILFLERFAQLQRNQASEAPCGAEWEAELLDLIYNICSAPNLSQVSYTPAQTLQRSWILYDAAACSVACCILREKAVLRLISELAAESRALVHELSPYAAGRSCLCCRHGAGVACAPIKHTTACMARQHSSLPQAVRMQSCKWPFSKLCRKTQMQICGNCRGHNSRRRFLRGWSEQPCWA